MSEPSDQQRREAADYVGNAEAVADLIAAKDRWHERAERAEARVRVLEAALEPFGSVGEPVSDGDWDLDEWDRRWKALNVGQFRDALAALRGTAG